MTAQPVSARERSAFGQFQLNRSAIDVGTDFTKVRKQASATEMAEMLREGVTLAEVCQAFDLAPSTIRGRLMDAGYASTGKPITTAPEPATDPPAPREDLSWQDDALCAQTDNETFFPEKGGSTREAKKICGACNVAAECLTHALATNEPFGVWGGLSEHERRKLRAEFTCPRCDDTFTTALGRDRHIKGRHQPPTNPATCPDCGRIFAHNGVLSAHRKTHTTDNLEGNPS